MIQELFSPQQSAILVLFSRPDSDNYELFRSEDANVKTIGTDDMSEVQMCQALESLGNMVEWRSKGTFTFSKGSEDKPYELKGDYVGMALTDFKEKYFRVVKGHDKPLPWCTDERPGECNPSLLSSEWESDAGIVKCRTEFPFEHNSPTVGGIQTDCVVYGFVDGRLYEIVVLFDTRSFDTMCDAFIDKYGPPMNESNRPRELTWANGVSSIWLSRGKLSPKEYSLLRFAHMELLSTVLERSPKRVDDL